MFTESDGNLQRLAVVNVEKNLTGKCIFMSILKKDDRCMAAIGGSVEEARRYVHSMKKQESFRQNPSLTGRPSP